MSIRFPKYVRITSGVAGGSGVRQRDLIGRLLSSSDLIGGGEVFEFTDAASVGAFFGATSPEYLRALFYFAWTSPSISAARRIGFARYAPTGATAKVLGNPDSTAQLATFTGISAGTLSFTFNGGAPIVVDSIDLSAAVSLAEVAAEVQAALVADGDPNFVNAVVTFDAPSGTFRFSNGLVQATTVDVQSTPLGVALGWFDGRDVAGMAAQSPSQAVTATVDVSDNFGSVAFVDDLVSLAAYEEVAAYVSGQNVRFMFMVPLRDEADAAAWAAALAGYAGTALTYAPIATEYPELVPMTILAATDYSKRNAVMNYMFKSFGGLSPSVDTDAMSDDFDAKRINYYGRTQTAGQVIQFYQRGYLMGTPSDPIDMNVYANEQWLKDAIGSDLMGLLLATNRVPANETGRGMVLAIIQGGIDRALDNGVISVGKPLTIPNKLFITQQTGDELAWHQVQNVGYWVDARIELDELSDPPAWRAVYTLIYSKDDAIRFIEGTHFLI